jgi:hypothetical protein
MIIALILLIAGCQLLNARSLRNLTPDEKARILDAQSARGAWPLIGIAVIAGIQMLLSRYVGYPRWLLPSFMTALLVCIFCFTLFELRRLRQIGLPAPYLRSIRLTRFVLFLGLLALFGHMLYRNWVVMHH